MEQKVTGLIELQRSKSIKYARRIIKKYLEKLDLLLADRFGLDLALMNRNLCKFRCKRKPMQPVLSEIVRLYCFTSLTAASSNIFSNSVQKNIRKYLEKLVLRQRVKKSL